MLTRRLSSVCGLIFLMAAINAGCGPSSPEAPPLGTVKGKVTVDGKPAAGLGIVFMPETGRSSTALTDKNGLYTLSFDDTHKGAVVGKHKVRITRDPENDMAEGRPPQPQLPPHYNVETTLEKEVVTGENTLDFELTSS
jgi:hypothetical protein